MEDITADEWRAELERVGKDDVGLTVMEIAVQTGRSERAVQRTVKRGVAEGRYIQGWATRLDTLGRRQRVPVYRIVKAGK